MVEIGLLPMRLVLARRYRAVDRPGTGGFLDERAELVLGRQLDEAEALQFEQAGFPGGIDK